MNMGETASPAEVISIENRQQGAMAVGGTAGLTPVLSAGIYDVWSDQDCYIKVSANPSDVLTSNGYRIFSNNVVPVFIPAGDRKIGAITTGGVGTFWFHQTS